MFLKLASLIALAAFGAAAPQHLQPAAQFPAGVDPARCPGFPICDNALLHSPQPAPQSGQWNHAAQPASAHNQWNSPAPSQWNSPAPSQWNSPAPSQWNSPAPSQWNSPAPATPQWNSPAPASNQWNSPAPQWTAPQAPTTQWAAPATADPYYSTGETQNWDSTTETPYYQQTQSAYNPPASNSLDSTGGDKYPAGVNPQACPNYPYCDTHTLGAGAAAAPAVPQVAPLPGYTERQYPAGVSPHQCPNFPYCS